VAKFALRVPNLMLHFHIIE